MKKEELLKRLKLKVLLVGDNGVGKTYTSVQIARAVAEAGKKVLYLDVDDGATLELLNLPDNALENIDHENIANFTQLKRTLKTKAPNYDLVVIDILWPFLRKWAREYARKLYIAQGYYWVGEKRVPIDNPQTFTLRGFMYQLPNELEEEIIHTLRELPAHIVATGYPEDNDESRNQLYGRFDIVLQLYNTAQGRVAKIVKVRANPSLENKLLSNHVEALVNKFKEMIGSV